MLKSIFILTAVFLALTGPAHANWEKVASDGASTYFVNFERMIKTGRHKREAWTLWNSNDGESHVVLSEYDCKVGKLRYLQYSIYDEPFGQGPKKHWFNTTSKWVAREPGSLDDQVVQAVCNH